MIFKIITLVFSLMTLVVVYWNYNLNKKEVEK